MSRAQRWPVHLDLTQELVDEQGAGRWKQVGSHSLCTLVTEIILAESRGEHDPTRRNGHVLTVSGVLLALHGSTVRLHAMS